jgi:hypothetical protein
MPADGTNTAFEIAGLRHVLLAALFREAKRFCCARKGSDDRCAPCSTSSERATCSWSNAQTSEVAIVSAIPLPSTAIAKSLLFDVSPHLMRDDDPHPRPFQVGGHLSIERGLELAVIVGDARVRRFGLYVFRAAETKHGDTDRRHDCDQNNELVHFSPLIASVPRCGGRVGGLCMRALAGRQTVYRLKLDPTTAEERLRHGSCERAR